MNFLPGDKVRFLNETGEGIVKKILSSNIILVETNDGFEQSFLVNELVAIKNESDYNVDGVDFNESIKEKINSEFNNDEESKFKQKFKHLKKYGHEDEMIIDLHIQELIDSYRGMSNAQILMVQKNHFRNKLHLAMNKGFKKIIVIHGKGKGVLKQEILNELNDEYPELKYYDASFKEYGYKGATEILIN